MSPRHDPPHRLPWSGLSSDDPHAPVGILGVPFDGEASFRKGAAAAPDRIRSLTPHVAPFTEAGLSLDGLRVKDAGNVEVVGSARQVRDASAFAARDLLRHPFCVFLGGDHSITVPAAQEVAELLKSRMGYLHLDAHLDLMNRFEGSSYSHACTARRVLELPGVHPENVAFVGIRSWLSEEVAYLEAHPALRVVTAAEVARRGAGTIGHELLSAFHAVAGLYVSVDIDVLDPAYAPGTGTPEAGGLSTRDLLTLLEGVFLAAPVRAMDVVEVSPALDASDITSFAAIKLLYEAFGWIHGHRATRRAQASGR